MAGPSPPKPCSVAYQAELEDLRFEVNVRELREEVEPDQGFDIEAIQATDDAYFHVGQALILSREGT